MLTVKNVKLNIQNIFEPVCVNGEAMYMLMYVYVLMERQCTAKFTLIFYGFLVFGNMFTIFFISYWISLVFEPILQCINRVFLNSPLTFRYGIQHVSQFFTFFFLKAKAFYLNYFTGPSDMQGEQYIPETVFHWCS